jgi:hypothetical protein
LSGTRRGKQARQYFLECERRAKDPIKALRNPDTLRALLLDYAEQNKTLSKVASPRGRNHLSPVYEEWILELCFRQGEVEG